MPQTLHMALTWKHTQNSVSSKRHQTLKPTLPLHHFHPPPLPVPPSSSTYDHNMTRKIGTALLTIFTVIIFFAYFSLYIFANVLSVAKVRLLNLPNDHSLNLVVPNDHSRLNFVIKEENHLITSSSIQTPPPDSILLPDWEVLIVDSPYNSLSSDSHEQYYCLFPKNVTSPAKFTRKLPFSDRSTFKCDYPESVRRIRPYRGPVLTKRPEFRSKSMLDSPEIFQWGFLAYETLSMETDVILFVKGVNNRQGTNRSPADLSCVFGNYSVKTAVTTSSQEVFRCHHPDQRALRSLFPYGDEKIKISLEIQDKGKRVLVPSVAYYTLPPKKVGEAKKSVLCACTMVHNVGKFLKEWVVYNSNLGVEKIILYDNDSEDELQKVVEELGEEQYNVETLLWPWPKTQEAGFSHCAMQARDSCTWMMYMDVDEFVYSPSWLNSSFPSHQMLTSLLPNTSASSEDTSPIGQISVRCLEFGPSNQSSHPISGVTQGYTCRMRAEHRHKSIVLLDKIDTSLHNAIHHFKLKQGYRVKTLRLFEGVVNHYKYQAWSVFKAKFRRRVSAYVVDWKKEANPMSQDRTPGLGFEPIEPEGWANRFCEVNDTRLMMATQRWFGLTESRSSRYKMAWQDQ